MRHRVVFVRREFTVERCPFICQKTGHSFALVCVALLFPLLTDTTHIACHGTVTV